MLALGWLAAAAINLLATPGDGLRLAIAAACAVLAVIKIALAKQRSKKGSA